jgi:hypothetical protein
MTDPTSVPVLACSLSVSEGTARAARWRELVGAHLLSRTTTADGLRLAFPSGDAAIARELDALVAAERECCPFLGLAVERFDDALVLDVTGPPEAARIVEAMFGSP